MPALSSLVIGGAAAAGGIAGAAGKKSSSSLEMNDPNAFENYLSGGMQGNYQGLEGLVNAGPGQGDVAAATGATRGLADLLNTYASSGGLPGEQDVAAAGGFARSIFSPQREALRQRQMDQSTENDRLSQRLGRLTNDPILRAKMQTAQLREEALLGAEEGSFQSQLALALPGQRLGYAKERVGVLSGLATSAFKNRAALLETGSSLQGLERQFRINTATKNNESGGGFSGALTGALGGAGFGLQASTFLNNGYSKNNDDFSFTEPQRVNTKNISLDDY